jgi:hypothetical protein
MRGAPPGRSPDLLDDVRVAVVRLQLLHSDVLPCTATSATCFKYFALKKQALQTLLALKSTCHGACHSVRFSPTLCQLEDVLHAVDDAQAASWRQLADVAGVEEAVAVCTHTLS